MTVALFIVEALTLIGLPIVIWICLRLVLEDVRQQRAKREAELASLRARLLERSEELQKAAVADIENFNQRVKDVGVVHRRHERAPIKWQTPARYVSTGIGPRSMLRRH
jgi:hypothetical protein